MLSSGDRASSFQVEDRIVDLARREVRHNERPVDIEPKAFDLLVYLIANRDRLVTKDDLIADVWRGRLVSDSALASALNAARSSIGDNGQEQRLIRTSARRGFRFIGPVTSLGQRQELAPEPSDGPSVAVMPFHNVSGEPDQEYFVDGLVEDLITALARFRSLKVVPRNASFAWKGKPYDLPQLASRLGARYVLEGSIRRAGGNLRIASRLIDSANGMHLWADRFDGRLEEVFELQDRIAACVLGAIAPAVNRAEIERARRKPVASLDAYDNFLRGLALFRQFGRDANRQARDHFYRAIELAPDFPTPYGFATHTYSAAKLQGWDFDPSSADTEVRRLSQVVAAVGQGDAWALSATGFSLAWICRDYDIAASFGEMATVLNPNLANVWTQRGAVSKFRGEHAQAIEQLARARTISPVGLEQALAQGYLGITLLFVARFEEAARCATQAASHVPHWLVGHLGSAAAHAFLGNKDEARRSLANVRRLNPTLRCSYLRNSFSYRRAEDGATLAKGLRLAGLAN